MKQIADVVACNYADGMSTLCKKKTLFFRSAKKVTFGPFRFVHIQERLSD